MVMVIRALNWDFKLKSDLEKQSTFWAVKANSTTLNDICSVVTYGAWLMFKEYHLLDRFLEKPNSLKHIVDTEPRCNQDTNYIDNCWVLKFPKVNVNKHIFKISHHSTWTLKIYQTMPNLERTLQTFMRKIRHLKIYKTSKRYLRTSMRQNNI